MLSLRDLIQAHGGGATPEGDKEERPPKSKTKQSLPERGGATNRKRRRHDFDEDSIEVDDRSAKEEEPNSVLSSSEEEEEVEDFEIGSFRSENQQGQTDNDDYEDDRFASNYAQSLETLYKTASQPSNSTPTDKDLRTIHETLVPTQKSVKTVLSKVEKFQPRTRISKKRGRSRAYQVKKETPQEAQLRVYKYQRYDEKHMVRRRWQQRKFNYTKEEDVGGAIEAMARRLMESKYRQDARERKRKRLEEEEIQEEKEKKRGEAARNDDENGNNDDSSVEEQVNLLERLTQTDGLVGGDGDTHDDEKKTETQTNIKDIEEAMIPYAEKWDYWKNGKAVPLDEDLDFDFGKELSLLSFSNPVKGTKREEKDFGLTGSIHRLTNQSYGGKPKISQHYFPINQELQSSSLPLQYIHWRHLRCLAARHLCGGVGCEEKEIRDLQNRFLRALTAKTRDYSDEPISYFCKKRSLVYYTQHRAINLLFYLKNNWKEPWKVAKAFDLVDTSSGRTIMQGRTLRPQSIQVHFRSKRNKIKTKFSLGERPITYETLEDTEEAEGDDMEEAEEEVKDDEMETTGAASEDGDREESRDLVSESPDQLIAASAPRIRRTGKRYKHRASVHKEASSRWLVPPTSLFAHVPGTKPPVPNFPLDATGIVFGPVDRHAKYFYRFLVDDDTYSITIATLLSRLAIIKFREKDDQGEFHEIQTQLQTFVKDFANIHHTNFYKRIASYQHDKQRDIPLVQYNKGLMGFCSLQANVEFEVYASQSDKRQHIATQEGRGLNTEDDGKQEGGDYREVANKIYGFCHERIEHNGLIRFPRVHVTYALARVARSLPESAAELLSRPIDESKNETPLDVIRKTFEYLEKNRKIGDGKQKLQDGRILAAELEYLMQDAAKKFRDCVKVDPVNPDYHLWHIGALSVCMLLCSGNTIGSGACLYPSSKKKGSFEILEKSTFGHEVRVKAGKFNHFRIELATAVKLLFSLARYQESPRNHKAIAAILEWKQVLSLLGGCSLKDSFEEVRQLHKFHTLKWAGAESHLAGKHLKRRHDSEILTFLAQNLENQPGDIDNWRKLVWALGPLGQDKKDDNDTHKDHCSECSRLRKPYVVDHGLRSKPSWWGRGRAWWTSGMLAESPQTAKLRARTELVIQKLEDVNPEISVGSTECDALVAFDDSVDSMTLAPAWLPTKASIENEYEEKDDKERTYLYDSDLPDPCTKFTVQPEIELEYSTKMKRPDLSGPNASQLELLCYSVLILGHLDVTHESIESHLRFLVKGSVKISSVIDRTGGNKPPVLSIREDCDELRALLWIYSMGLDIPRIMRDDLKPKKYFYRRIKVGGKVKCIPIDSK